jgi:hypothetical protein
MMWACASLMSRRNAVASSGEPCLSSQFTWPSSCPADRTMPGPIPPPVLHRVHPSRKCLSRFPTAHPKPQSGFHVRLQARVCAAHTPVSPYAGPRFHNPYTRVEHSFIQQAGSNGPHWAIGRSRIRMRSGESPIPRPPGFRAGLFNLSSVDLAVHGVGVPARRSVLGRVR